MCFECMVVVCFHLFECVMLCIIVCTRKCGNSNRSKMCVLLQCAICFMHLLGYISICTCVKLFWQLLRVLSAAIFWMRFSWVFVIYAWFNNFWNVCRKILLHTKVTRYDLDIIFKNSAIWFRRMFIDKLSTKWLQIRSRCYV